MSNHYSNERIEEAVYKVFPPNISFITDNREEEEKEKKKDDKSRYFINKIIRNQSEYNVKKANQTGCINSITGVFNDLLKKMEKEDGLKKLMRVSKKE